MNVEYIFSLQLKEIDSEQGERSEIINLIKFSVA